MPKQELVIDGPVSYFEKVPLKHGFTVNIKKDTTEDWFEVSNMANSRERTKGNARRNREKIYKYFSFDKKKIVHMVPEFSNRVEFVDRRDGGKLIRCDALITSTPELVLELCPADCHPIIITNRDKDFLALIHGGYKALEKDLIKKAKPEKVVPYLASGKKDINPETVGVLIGPGIRDCCYQFDLLKLLGVGLSKRWRSFINWKKRSLDLLGFIIDELKRVEIPEKNIIYSDVCTSCSKRNEEDYLFFSHRRAVRTGEKEGRFLALASLA